MPKFNYLALALGAAFSVATAYSVYSTLDFIGATQTAPGEVVATPIGPHHPVVVFTDVDGNKVRFQANGDISGNVGDQVTVRYSRENPERTAKLDTFGSLWGGTLVLLAMVVCFIIAGLRNIAPGGWGPQE
ncbi:DUF3592 domain-containing protein [Paraburkholderia heleia]|uniref:DUF3592 domain-containing protein n=1 Tax=Paraburkholderia heleia TaxID=634127 RepID=UPI000693EAFB|nr:DUF3592 domain-containing protein [Paraburkholderia heleia]